MTRIIRACSLVFALVVFAVALASPVNAQPYVGSSVSVSSSNVICGATLVGSGTGWAPGVPVSLTVQSPPVSLPPAIPDASGNFTVNFESPIEPGPHTLTATQVFDGVTLTRVSEFTCAEAAAGSATRPVNVTSAGTLPLTGGDSAPLAQFGIGLLAIGALVVLIVRMRRAHPA